MSLKWTKEEPGHYVSGDWHVKGSGTSWDLYKKKTHVHGPCKSKKECQQVAEDPSFATPSNEDEPQESTTKPKGKSVNLDDLHGVLISLYHEITHLTAAVAAQAHYEKKLGEAVVLLSRHVAKLEK